MKKISITLLLIATLFAGFTGCKEVSKLTQVRLPYSTQFTIPEIPVIMNSPIPVVSPAIPTNIETTLEGLGFKMDLVERIEIEKFDMELNAPADGDLNFFNTIQIYIEAEGLEKVLLAEKTVEESASKLSKVSLDCKNINLLDYFKNPEITLSATVTTDKLVTREHTIDAKSVFMVDVKVLGL